VGKSPGTPEPGGWVSQDWSAVSWADGAAGLDLKIDSGSLHTLRARVRACAEAAGLPDDRVEDVVLAIHELAANVVRHGGGTGRLRAWDLPGAMRFQVDDGDRPPLGATGRADGYDGYDGSGGSDGSGARAEDGALPFISGHGLWVVQRICSHMIARSGPGGTSVVVVFDRPRA
jgi:serine/threonine-protein kinase RsbW